MAFPGGEGAWTLHALVGNVGIQLGQDSQDTGRVLNDGPRPHILLTPVPPRPGWLCHSAGGCWDGSGRSVIGKGWGTWGSKAVRPADLRGGRGRSRQGPSLAQGGRTLLRFWALSPFPWYCPQGEWQGFQVLPTWWSGKEGWGYPLRGPQVHSRLKPLYPRPAGEEEGCGTERQQEPER